MKIVCVPKVTLPNGKELPVDVERLSAFFKKWCEWRKISVSVEFVSEATFNDPLSQEMVYKLGLAEWNLEPFSWATYPKFPAPVSDAMSDRGTPAPPSLQKDVPENPPHG